MNRNFLRILLTLAAVSVPALFLGVNATEGSWFDGMEFEEYHPPDQQDGSEPKFSQQIVWRIPCGLIREWTDPSVASSVLPLSTAIDINQSTSTIHDSFLQLNFDKDESSKLTVQDATNGTHYIPSGSLWLRMGSTKATVMAPQLEVVVTTTHSDKNKNEYDGDDDSIQLRLGMDFMSMYQGRLDAEGAGGLFLVLKNHGDDDGANIGDDEVLVPIWQPRSPINHEEL
ncbi:unnamed protein product [Cylindrotheca closterium]|uniref:Uncharacterized protein n=1 Tax=Cylindrotheca closterium TaxID=2856 RepID=A0AAD2G3U5_9STRA|nr:unnamed protein product [Cylindrotheca closterium]